jgi:hypothetical protein
VQSRRTTPAEWQEDLWVGAGGLTGLDSPAETFLRTLGARVAYTADQLKTSPSVVLRKLVKGEIPILELAGGAVGLSALQVGAGSPETRPR